MADGVEITKNHRLIARTGIFNSVKAMILKDNFLTDEEVEDKLKSMELWSFIENQIEVKATDIASSLLMQWQLGDGLQCK